MAGLLPVSPGQPLRFSAGDINACFDAARAHKAKQMAAESESRAIRDPSIVLIRNDTATDLDFMSVLGIDVPLILPADNLNEWRSRVMFSAVDPTEDHAGKFCVLQEPIPAGKMGRAMLIGVTPVVLDVTDEADGFADVADGVTATLKSGTHGSARILWKEAGTGTGKKSVVAMTCVRLPKFNVSTEEPTISDEGADGDLWFQVEA